MKKVLVVFACLTVLAMTVSTVSAQGPWSQFEGTLTKIADLPGGEEYFSKDFTKIFIRDLSELYIMDVDDPRLDGELTFTFNGILNITDEPVFVYGQFSGSVYLENAGGYWEGNNFTRRTEEGYNYGFSVLHGHGDYEGMLAHVNFTREVVCLYCEFEVDGFVK
jgi:hypothetical protein